MNLRLTAALLTLTAASLALGCAGGADPSQDDDVSSESGEDALTESQLPGVAAMKFESPGRSITIGAPAKVTKAMKALAKPGGSTPRCSFGPATKITFFDKDGKTIANGSYFCFLGSVTTKNGTTIRFQTRPGGLSVLDEPLVPADALWGITRIKLERRTAFGGPATQVELSDAASIGKVMKAFDVEQKIDLGYSGTRCPPSHIVTFRRGNDEVATSSFVCDASGAAASVTALFTISGDHPEAEPAARGGVKVDARRIDELLPAQH